MALLGEVVHVYLAGYGPAGIKARITGQLQPSAVQPKKGSDRGRMWLVRGGSCAFIRFTEDQIGSILVKENHIHLK